MDIMTKYKYGYCAVTADFLHIGHIKFIHKCKIRCKFLIVGIMTDECVEKYKGRKPVMNYKQRRNLVLSLKDVSFVMPQDEFEFVKTGRLMAMKELYGKNFAIFDSLEHDRKGADFLFPRMKEMSCSLFKKEYML